MYRTFEELGVAVDGVAYGHFTGEAEFDRAGSVVQITIERSGFSGEPLSLDIDHLVRERIAMRRTRGSGFLEDGNANVQAHRRKFELFLALSETIEKVYADDIREYVAEARDSARFDAA